MLSKGETALVKERKQRRPSRLGGVELEGLFLVALWTDGPIHCDEAADPLVVLLLLRKIQLSSSTGEHFKKGRLHLSNNVELSPLTPWSNHPRSFFYDIPLEETRVFALLNYYIAV